LPAQLLRTDPPAAGLAGRPTCASRPGACGAVGCCSREGRSGRPDSPALPRRLTEGPGHLDAFGVRPTTGVGYSLGEITGLAWAGCIPAAEAARLWHSAARSCGPAPRDARDGRVAADGTWPARWSAGRLDIAAYEGPRTHVLAGSTAGVRELTRRAAMLKVPVEVLDSAAPMHSSGLASAPPRAERPRGHQLRAAPAAAGLHHHRPPGHP